VVRVCRDDGGVSNRDAAWKELLVRVAPFLERWARKSRVLRLSGSSLDDDARAVLVGVIARLRQRDFENLRRYLGAQPPTDLEDASAAAGTGVESLVLLEDPPPSGVEAGERDGDELAGTPLRGWLLSLVRFVARDHVRPRLGFASADESGVARPSRRDVSSGAERLDVISEPGFRPPVTDLLTQRRVIEEVREHMATFPTSMRRSLELWIDDASFEEIASHLGTSEDDARSLVRAGQARLRARFRKPTNASIESREGDEKQHAARR
jgi:DNA-directed RNA polymerase specialized sigma24 family protein